MQDVDRLPFVLPFVRVHIGRGQDTCISEQARRTRRTPTAGGVDGVKTVGRPRGAAHAQDADGQWSRRCEDGGGRQMIIVLLLFLQKQNLATAIYLFGLGTLLMVCFVVDGYIGLGVPIGTDAFIQHFVKDKCQAIMDEVDKLDNIQDGFIHYQLLRFCQATRLQYPNGQIDLVNQNSLQQQHVDWKIINTLLKKGTREADNDVFYLFLQKQNLGAKLHIYL
jgi:hypothetical protein